MQLIRSFIKVGELVMKVKIKNLIYYVFLAGICLPKFIEIIMSAERSRLFGFIHRKRL
jgi:hypothetical protein